MCTVNLPNKISNIVVTNIYFIIYTLNTYCNK